MFFVGNAKLKHMGAVRFQSHSYTLINHLLNFCILELTVTNIPFSQFIPADIISIRFSDNFLTSMRILRKI